MKTASVKLVKNVVEALWQRYLKRVPYARVYSDLILSQGGKVIHDHIAFRTFNTATGGQPPGIDAISHLLEMLNYSRAGKYKFPKMMVTAVHYEHPDPLLPKIFVSQLEVEDLPQWAGQIIRKTVAEAPYLLPEKVIALMNILKTQGNITTEAAEILNQSLPGYFRRPWKLPHCDELLKINDVSQYAAWVLLHGNAVNHFAANINLQNVAALPDIDATYIAMANAGVPMKAEIEGVKGSILRQTSTQAVKENITFKDEDGRLFEMPWTYAYYELAERGYVFTDFGEKLFTGFIADQATELFKMTGTRDN